MSVTMDTVTYLNNKINQSKINSNGKGQEEIKDGWLNTEICKKKKNSITSALLQSVILQQEEHTMTVAEQRQYGPYGFRRHLGGS
jgi:hypothetical protein